MHCIDDLLSLEVMVPVPNSVGSGADWPGVLLIRFSQTAGDRKILRPSPPGKAGFSQRPPGLHLPHAPGALTSPGLRPPFFRWLLVVSFYDSHTAVIYLPVSVPGPYKSYLSQQTKLS